MKTKITALFFVSLLVLALAFSGCSGADLDKQAIYGDDVKIAAEGDSYTFTNRVGSADDDAKLDLAYDGFSGSNSIWTVDFAEFGTLTVEYESNVTRGDFKVVLVGPETQVITLFEGTELSGTTADLTAGKYTIKLVGREASGTVKMTLEVAGNATVTRLDK